MARRDWPLQFSATATAAEQAATVATGKSKTPPTVAEVATVAVASTGKSKSSTQELPPIFDLDKGENS
jgi:hypothetical protein